MSRMKVDGYEHCSQLFPKDQKEFLQMRDKFDEWEYLTNKGEFEVYYAYNISGHNGSYFAKTLIFRKHPRRPEGE